MADGIGNPEAVLFEERATAGGQCIGIAQLNAEKSLNALNLDMIRLLDPKLRAWAADPGIVCVVLAGAGEKGFCAGGDVRYLRDASLAHQASGPNPGANPGAQAFFAEEYRLNHRIHTYAKPILVWGTGIVMGGGLGLMVGASHRVVTETSRIAMPEISIGLYPDVGGSWFLRRMPGRIGLFLALTGAALNAHDALVAGLAEHFVRAADRQPLLERLRELSWGGTAEDHHEALSGALREFARRAQDALPESNLRRNADAIQTLTEGAHLRDVVSRIAGYTGDDPWLKRGAAALAGGSPTSIALTWALWQRAKHLGLADVFRLELIVSLACCAHPDFPEGVRALLIDKDNRPRWTPATLDAVSDGWIAEHFTAPWPSAEAHPLADL